MSENQVQATYRVLYGDTDAMGIVYNANYLRFFEIGRNEFMRNMICSYTEILKMGIDLPLTESWIRYKSPAFYDDILIIETRIQELSRVKIQFNYRICREDKDQDRLKLLAKGYSTHAATNREGKLTKLPEELVQKIASVVTETAKTDKLFR